MTAEARRTRVTRTVRAFVGEVRETLAVLGDIATIFLMVFLAGSLLGTFIFGVKWIANMAP